MSMAATAGMSRTQFAASFHQHIGLTPATYLMRWRLTAAQQLLDAGRPLKLIVDEVGYRSAAALSRAFKAHTGESPRIWKQRDA